MEPANRDTLTHALQQATVEAPEALPVSLHLTQSLLIDRGFQPPLSTTHLRPFLQFNCIISYNLWGSHTRGRWRRLELR